MNAKERNEWKMIGTINDDCTRYQKDVVGSNRKKEVDFHVEWETRLHNSSSNSIGERERRKGLTRKERRDEDFRVMNNMEEWT